MRNDKISDREREFMRQLGVEGMQAHLSLNAGGLIAQLEIGGRIVAGNAHKMAEQLRLAGVTADSLTVTDWKTDPDHAPTSGQIIAVKAALRGLPSKTDDSDMGNEQLKETKNDTFISGL